MIIFLRSAFNLIIKYLAIIFFLKVLSAFYACCIIIIQVHFKIDFFFIFSLLETKIIIILHPIYFFLDPLMQLHARIQRGVGGGVPDPPPPLKNHKIIGFLSNTCPDLLKNHKATKPAFNVGPSTASHGSLASQ